MKNHRVVLNGQEFKRRSANREYSHTVIGYCVVADGKWGIREDGSYGFAWNGGFNEKLVNLGWCGSRVLADRLVSSNKSTGCYTQFFVLENDSVRDIELDLIAVGDRKDAIVKQMKNSMAKEKANVR